MIRTMRGQSKRGGETGNYTDFDDTGFFLDEYGVQRYYSKRIRNLSTEVPAKKWLKCNNLGEYRTGCHNPS